jgi:hypothetical protein
MRPVRAAPALAIVALGCGGDDLRTTAPKISVAVAALEFGAVAELQRKELSLTVENQGRGTLHLTARVDGSPDFGVIAAPAQLRPGSSGEVRVVFVPVGQGADTGTLAFESDDPENPRVEIAVTGGPIFPELTPSPDPLTFVPSSQPVETRALTLASSGLARLSVASIALAPGGNPDFALAADGPALPAALDPGASLEVNVVYTRSTRTGGAVLVLSSDDPTGERRVRLFPDPLTAECAPSDPPRACWSGSAETRKKGRCRDGTQSCEVDKWGDCTGEVLPLAEEICGNAVDDDCDAATDETPCRSGCAFAPSVGSDAFEPNNDRPGARHETTVAGVANTFNYDLTLPPGDHDWFRFDIPASGGTTYAKGEVKCAGWGAAGCGTAPAVGLELWYMDDLGSNQRDDQDNGQAGFAVVQNSGPINSLFAVQRWLIHAFTSTAVCTGEAANATLQVTITNQ